MAICPRPRKGQSFETLGFAELLKEPERSEGVSKDVMMASIQLSARKFDALPRVALSRLRSGAGLDRAHRHPLVCARLYRRHPARLALRPRADPRRGIVG